MSVSVSVGGREISSTEIKVRDIFIVGMGDSFGSGEGNPDVPVRFSHERSTACGEKAARAIFPAIQHASVLEAGRRTSAFIDENARWLDQACHRSLYSFEMRARAPARGRGSASRRDLSPASPAPGAEVTFGLFLHYKGNEWVPNPPGSVADLGRRRRAMRPPRCARRGYARGLSYERRHPRAEGGVALSKCPARGGTQNRSVFCCRSAATTWASRASSLTPVLADDVAYPQPRRLVRTGTRQSGVRRAC